jgi:glycosyltransferase involved in cell wall biosynthesis
MNTSQSLTIVLNLLPLKTGGGVQVALDFLSQIGRHGPQHKWYIVARENTPFSDAITQSQVAKVFLVPDNLLARIGFELIGGAILARRLGAQVIYTIFGPQWYNTKLPQVVGCGYSNLLYPDVTFWKGLSVRRRLIKVVIDSYRRSRLKSADVALFETDNMARRAVSVLKMCSDRVKFVSPSVSSLVRRDRHCSGSKLRLARCGGAYRVLALAGYHPNKNLELIPEVLFRLRTYHGQKDVVFVTTMQPCRGLDRIVARANELDVADGIDNIGPLPQSGCVEAYRACDAVMLASRLESFSNNITEAWEMRRPLLIANLDWANGICGKGAAYFKYNDPDDLAANIATLRRDPWFAAAIVEHGAKRLEMYPTSSERYAKIEEILRETARLV